MDEDIVIVPARKGSKGLPNKHHKLVGSKSLIQHTFDTCSDLALETCILTDDDEIKALAVNYDNFDASYSRPPRLSDDGSSVVDLIADYLALKGITRPVNIILLQPTNPFRDANEILSALRWFKSNELKSLAFYGEPLSEPNDCFAIDNDRFVLDKYQEGRQKKVVKKFLSGECYISNSKHLLKTGSFVDRDTFAWQSKNWKGGVDIDYLFQLELANMMTV
jgi:CMP-N,N'-diacetyllegionaminic acid synthase